jgi:hypothetical protein
MDSRLDRLARSLRGGRNYLGLSDYYPPLLQREAGLGKRLRRGACQQGRGVRYPGPPSSRIGYE